MWVNTSEMNKIDRNRFSRISRERALREMHTAHRRSASEAREHHVPWRSNTDNQIAITEHRKIPLDRCMFLDPVNGGFIRMN